MIVAGRITRGAGYSI